MDVMSCVDVTVPPLNPNRPLLLVAAAALIDAEGRVLLAKRPGGKNMAGLWEFPGGKVHHDETPEAALVRELHEELGITTSTGCLWPLAFASHGYEKFHLLMPLYGCRVWQNEPQGKENQELAWVTKQQLKDYSMPPADIGLVQTLWELL
jgi:8-oxo-dGTP diphosphatase